MKSVTVLFTRFKDTKSRLFRYLTLQEFTDCAFSLEEAPELFYSFTRQGLSAAKRREGDNLSVTLSVSDSVYANLKLLLKLFEEERSLNRYSSAGAVLAFLHLRISLERRYFCSHFVADLLSRSGAVMLRDRAEATFHPSFYLNSTAIRLL